MGSDQPLRESLLPSILLSSHVCMGEIDYDTINSMLPNETNGTEVLPTSDDDDDLMSNRRWSRRHEAEPRTKGEETLCEMHIRLLLPNISRDETRDTVISESCPPEYDHLPICTEHFLRQ